MQLALDNAGGELMPGGYANVAWGLARDAVPLHIGERPDLQPKRYARCDGRLGRQGAVQDRDHRPRLGRDIEWPREFA